MKIAIAQINTKVGDFGHNVRKILDYSGRAAKWGADLVVFPEAALTGYPALDLWEDRDFVNANLKALKELSNKIKDTACLVGYIDRNRKKTGKPLFNCAALISGGKIVGVRAKTLLPTYDVFDEARYFESADSNFPVKLAGARLGITVCEDIWNEKKIFSRKLYRADPVHELIKSSPDIFINISASPYYTGKARTRYDLLSSIARKCGVPFVYCNLAGANDGLIFDGNSLVFDGKGRLAARGKAFQEDLFLVDFSVKQPGLEWQEPPEAEEIYNALVLGVRDYCAKTGFSTVALGLSGGVDSAVVCCLAAEALGPKNVYAVFMPTEFTSSESREDAKRLAANLGVKFSEIGVSGLFRSFLETLRPFFEKRPEDITEQNLQSRIRAGVLMALSNKLGCLVLNTGNKSELATGYCTLYGDMCGGLSVLGDTVKTRVYSLAKHINRAGEIIPGRTLTRAPTAELKPGQKDQDDLPPYEMLDPVVQAYIEDKKNSGEIIKLGFPREMVLAVLDKIDRMEYKRFQAPPVLKITPKAFGAGRRMPIARGFSR